MNLNDYQQLAFSFARFSFVDYPFLALSEEVGEVSGKLAKFSRKNSVTLTTAILMAARDDSGEIKPANSMQLEKDLIAELGDCFWQLAACCTVLGLTLDEVAEANLDKLSGREERGTIVGSGDSR